jgi:hypothetical protein
VTVNDNCSIYINNTNTIDDAAGLFLNGAKSSKDDTHKLYLNADEAIGILRIDGLPQQNGTWGATNSTATFTTNTFTGAGILTVRWTEIPAAGTVLIVK